MVTPTPPPRADTSDAAAAAAAAVGADDAPALLVQPQFLYGAAGTTAVSATVAVHVHGSYPAAPWSFLPSCPGEASVHATTTGTTVESLIPLDHIIIPVVISINLVQNTPPLPSAGFSMVFHPEAGWGGLPTRVQKTKIYLETDEHSSTPPFSKKHLAGAILHYKSAREVKSCYN
jgi:hypothetical protein